MEYFLLLLSLILLITGIIGSVLPALPGLPLSWLGILCLYFTPGVESSTTIVVSTLIVTIVVSILDYVIPAKGTKYFGGSKYGVWGTNIGLVIGLFIPVPFAFLIGPFVGALIGELLFDKTNVNRALKAAIGSILGFLASTLMKVTVCLIFCVLAVKMVWDNASVWF